MPPVRRALGLVVLVLLAWGLAFGLGILSHGSFSADGDHDVSDRNRWFLWLFFPVILAMGAVITAIAVRNLMAIARDPMAALASSLPAVFLGALLFGGALAAFFAGTLTPYWVGWWGHERFGFVDNEVPWEQTALIGFTASGALGGSMGGLMGLVLWSRGAVKAR